MIRESVNESAAGRMTGDERRSQILQVVIKLFSQNGFRGTTTKEIARAAGVSEAMVFRHYATKDDLYTAILDWKACEGKVTDSIALVGEAMKENDDYKVFYTMMLNALRKHERDPQFMRLLFFSALEGHNLADMFIEQNIAPFYELLSAYIARRQKEGAMRKDIKPRIVVRAFVGLMIHHALNNSLWDTRKVLLDISNEEAAKNFTEILLKGVKS